MLAMVEGGTSSMRVDPAIDNERRIVCVTDVLKGMIFAGSTKCCTYRAIAIPRSGIESKNRYAGINEKFDILSMHHYL
jgi:hypothetical protein